MVEDYKGSTVEDLVDLIAIQKYISNCGIDPFESWCDERRLHMLELLADPNTPIGIRINEYSTYISANPSKISSTIPIRMLYPQSEYTTNKAQMLRRRVLLINSVRKYFGCHKRL